jgi:hypothetical protein
MFDHFLCEHYPDNYPLSLSFPSPSSPLLLSLSSSSNPLHHKILVPGGQCLRFDAASGSYQDLLVTISPDVTADIPQQLQIIGNILF